MSNKGRLKWYQHLVPALLTGGLSLPVTHTRDILGRANEKVQDNKARKQQQKDDWEALLPGLDYETEESNLNLGNNNILIAVVILAAVILTIVIIRKQNI